MSNDSYKAASDGAPQLSLGPMNSTKRPLNTSWWVIIRMMVLFGLMMWVVVLIKSQPGDRAGMASAFVLLWLSMVAFFSLRWRSLRADLASGACTEAQFRLDGRRYIIGSKRVALWWFTFTTAAILFVTVISALKLGPYA